MSIVRECVRELSDEELWEIFSQGEDFEATGVVQENAQLLLIAKSTMEENALVMLVDLHEVWRELALRGSDHLR